MDTSGPPKARQRAAATGWAVTRTATLPRPPVTQGPAAGPAGRTQVTNPGQVAQALADHRHEPGRKDQQAEREALRQRINTHIASEVSAMKGRLVDWDVINEPLDYTNIDGGFNVRINVSG